MNGEAGNVALDGGPGSAGSEESDGEHGRQYKNQRRGKADKSAVGEGIGYGVPGLWALWFRCVRVPTTRGLEAGAPGTHADAARDRRRVPPTVTRVIRSTVSFFMFGRPPKPTLFPFTPTAAL